MRSLCTIALVLALCSIVHAGDKVDWSQYIEKNPSSGTAPAKKPAAAQPARPAAKATTTKAKPTTAKPAASAKAKPRRK